MKSFSPVLAALILICIPALAHAQLITTMTNGEGVSLPCVTVGPLAAVAEEYCVRRTEAEGFLSKREVGFSGLTIGVAGQDDGVITALAPGSAAAAASVAIGDSLVFIDGRPVRRPAGEIAEELTFGARGARLRITLTRGAQTLEVSYMRAAAPEPPGMPHSPSFLLGIHPMVNWRGQFIPCMGAGLLGPAVVAACLSHYGQDGFVNVAALGATGLTFDPQRPDTAVVMTVEPSSPASIAGVRTGDVVTEVNGHLLSVSRGREARMLLFGKAGARRQIVVDRSGRRVVASIILSRVSTP